MASRLQNALSGQITPFRHENFRVGVCAKLCFVDNDEKLELMPEHRPLSPKEHWLN